MIHSSSETTGSQRFQIIFWILAVLAFFYFIALIKSILLPFVVGILTAYFLDPAVKKLCTMKLSRSSSAAIITIGFFSIAIALCVILPPLVSHQLLGLLKSIPEYLVFLQNRYGNDINTLVSHITHEPSETVKDTISNFSGTIAGWAGGILSDVLRSGLAFLNILSLIFITPIVAFYLLRDWDKLVIHFDGMLPRRHEKIIMQQLHEIDITLSGFIRGQTNISLIMSGFYSVLLSVIDLNFALGVGILSGFMLFIPFVGYAFCFALAVIITLFQFGFTSKLAIVIAIYLVGMFLESSILTPRLIGGQVGLHPLWIIFGVLAGAALFGFVGVLISVPVTAVAGVLVRFAMQHYRNSSLYKGSVAL